ncbi:hypothetical protein ACN20G_01690 [Streptomyces sp. BI20]|uniref:hypothetical protein n=1 Tax=Streptomyces sp. BI20 TaxID=3403460 RepID=UPI003C736057
MTGDVRLVRELVSEFPLLDDLYQAHLYNHDGQIFAHALFWDLVPEVIESFISDDPGALDWRGFLGFLDDWFRREDKEANKVIVTSFLWRLPFPGSPGHEIVDHLSPAMRETFRQMRPHG